MFLRNLEDHHEHFHQCENLKSHMKLKMKRNAGKSDDSAITSSHLIGLLSSFISLTARPTSHAILSVQSLPLMPSKTSLVSAESSSGACLRAEIPLDRRFPNFGKNRTEKANMSAIPTKPATAMNSGSTLLSVPESTIIIAVGIIVAIWDAGLLDGAAVCVCFTC